MAIKVYIGKPYVFEWDGLRVGMRLPNVEEMIEITRARDAYFATISDDQPQGDQAILTKFQFVVGSLLACDPDDIKNPWFAETREKQRELQQNQVNKDVAEDMPSSFFVAITGFFNKTITRANLSDPDRAEYDKELAKIEGDSQAGNSEVTETPPSGMPATPTVQSSDDSYSGSQNTSSAPQTLSEPGVMTVS